MPLFIPSAAPSESVIQYSGVRQDPVHRTDALLRTERLPEGPDWLHELKFDGYRALAIKAGGKVHLRSRNDNDFSARYPAIVKALAAMPDETVIDGEIIALDVNGKPFNLLQN